METWNQSPRRFERWGLFTIIAFLLGIVMVPIGIAYWPIERARWLLAAADNALAISAEDPESRKEHALALLRQASEIYPPIENTMDYMRVSYRVKPIVTERAIRLIESLAPSQKIVTATVLAERCAEYLDFGGAYAILVAGYPESRDRKDVHRNQIAYFAALAKRDLDDALREIELALESEKNASYLDTKAWVLFRLNRYPEALEAIDQAMKQLDEEIRKPTVPAPLREKIDDLLQGRTPFVKRPLSEKKDPLATFSRDYAQFLRSIVVLHYHRGEILEAAGKIEEADEEYSWVQDRGFNDFERLY